MNRSAASMLILDCLPSPEEQLFDSKVYYSMARTSWKSSSVVSFCFCCMRLCSGLLHEFFFLLVGEMLLELPRC